MTLPILMKSSKKLSSEDLPLRHRRLAGDVAQPHLAATLQIARIGCAEQQRLVILRLLLVFVFVDEPAFHRDPTARPEVNDRLGETARRRGGGILLARHHPARWPETARRRLSPITRGRGRSRQDRHGRALQGARRVANRQADATAAA